MENLAKNKSRRFSSIFIITIVIFLFSFCPFISAESKKITLIVDNSGSMYGHLNNQNVMPEVKKSLEIILELLHAYNRGRPDSDKAELVLTLFGGVTDEGRKEFREIELTTNLDENLSIINNELVPVEGKYYVTTSFSLAFRESIEVLEKRGKADYTIFLTDAVSSGPTASDENLESRYLGNIILYSLGLNISPLEKWHSKFVKDGLDSEVIKLNEGWEIVTSFIKVFLNILLPESNNKYLFVKDDFPINKRKQVGIEKISEKEAIYRFVFHGENMPKLAQILFEGKEVQRNLYHVEQGTIITTVSMKGGTKPGEYKFIFSDDDNSAKRITTIGREAVELVLIESNHIESGIRHQRNEEIEFDFNFAHRKGDSYVQLSDNQLEHFRKLVNVDYLIQEKNGTETIRKPKETSKLEFTQKFSPSSSEDQTYIIKTGWSYIDLLPVPATLVGSFIIGQEVSPELQLTFQSDRDGFWQGREFSIRGSFLYGDKSVPDNLLSQSTVIIRNTTTGKTYSLPKVSDNTYILDIGTINQAGVHKFSLISPTTYNNRAILLSGKELEIKEREIIVESTDVYNRFNPIEETFFRKIGNGFRFLIGVKSPYNYATKGRITDFPAEKNVFIQYYDEDSFLVKLKPSITPLFEDEVSIFIFSYTGPKSYNAENVHQPKCIHFIGKEISFIKYALTITT